MYSLHLHLSQEDFKFVCLKDKIKKSVENERGTGKSSWGKIQFFNF